MLATLLCACGPRSAAPGKAPAGDDITLYRDWALIRQRFALDLPAGRSQAKLVVAAGVSPDQVAVVDRGGLQIGVMHAANAIEPPAKPAKPANEDEPDSDPFGSTEDEPPKPAAPPPLLPGKPSELGLDVVAPHAGKFAITIAYLSDRLRWDAAYTMTTSPARDRSTLRGAIAIRNAMGIALRDTDMHVIDAELPVWRGKTAEQLATALTGTAAGGTQSIAQRELGRIELGPGETRVELLGREPARKMRSVLVYDPVGTKLDNPGAAPLRDYTLGVMTSSTTVVESFAIDRDESATVGLPAGPVRLLERRDDGSLAMLGEAKLFESATRVAGVDTIAVGTAEDVTARRDRRELSIDDDNRRVVEEFVISIDNRRPRPVRVLLREHLYRGQNWTLAYTSAYAEKEGPQQISLTTTVPAKSQQKVLYVVVYTWPQ